MLLTMLVTLFTSRVILQVLGVDDFGIYQTVGGVVALLAFLNTALSAGSSRFLTFELGRGDFEKLRRTFSSIVIVHTILALIIVFLAETVGLWFVYNKLLIPSTRLEATVIAYHFSVITIFFSITQVPYNATIISHEKMSVYAYLSIIEVLLKLAVVYLLLISSWDKLKVYAMLLCAIQVGIVFSYRLYCRRNFSECRGALSFDKGVVKDVLKYSSWNLLTNTAAVGVVHGTTVLINIFFNPGVVTARAIANQVNNAANQLTQNFRNAANPQIVKRLAQDDFEGSKRLLLISTKVSFYLMLFICIPICFEADLLLRLWLGIIPEYSVVFLRLTIITTLIQTFSQSFYTALYAKGKIRENALLTSIIGFATILVIYILFKAGFSPIALAWTILVEESILALLVKPMLVVKIAGYKWIDMWNVFSPCCKVFLLSSSVPLIAYITLLQFETTEYFKFAIIIFSSTSSSLYFVWHIGLDVETRQFAKQMLIKFKNRWHL